MINVTFVMIVCCDKFVMIHYDMIDYDLLWFIMIHNEFVMICYDKFTICYDKFVMYK